jgi:hypothetical protein
MAAAGLQRCRRRGPQVPRLPPSGGRLAAPISPHRACPALLRSFDLWQPDERRLVLLVERDDVEDAKPLVVAGDDSSSARTHLSVGHFSVG